MYCYSFKRSSRMSELKLLALTRAKLRSNSMHSELSYGLSIAPKLQRVGSIHFPGWDQPTPDPSFSQNEVFL